MSAVLSDAPTDNVADPAPAQHDGSFPPAALNAADDVRQALLHRNRNLAPNVAARRRLRKTDRRTCPESTQRLPPEVSRDDRVTEQAGSLFQTDDGEQLRIGTGETAVHHPTDVRVPAGAGVRTDG